MKKIFFLFIAVLLCQLSFAQENKRPLTWDDIQKWNRISQTTISDDGNIIAYQLRPWKGDNILKIKTKNGKEKISVIGGENPLITKNSDFVIYTIKPLADTLRALKLKKTKKEEMPVNELGIYNIKTGNEDRIACLKSYKTAEEPGTWIAYQTEPAKEKEKGKEKTKENPGEEKKEKKESNKNGFTLTIRNLEIGLELTRPFVTQYYFSEEEKTLVFVTTGNDEDTPAGIYCINLGSNEQNNVLESKGEFKQITLNKDGSKLAFLLDTCTKKKSANNYALYLWNGKHEAIEILNNNNDFLPEGWIISEDGRLNFTDKKNRLFFGIAPKPLEKDSTILDEEIPGVDVWHYKEPILQTVQIINRNKDLKKTYEAVYHIDEQKAVKIGGTEFTGIDLLDEGNADFAFGVNNVPYALQTMWDNYPSYYDFYLIDIKTGQSKIFKKECPSETFSSPEGNFIYWYNPLDSTLHTYNVNTKKEYTIASPENIQLANEMTDVPMPAYPYGQIGWMKDDKALLVYDRFDIWKLDPENKKTPLNLTQNGRANNISYRVLSFNKRKDWRTEGINEKEELYLHGHNEISRGDGYYKISLKKSGEPKKLIAGEYMLTNRPQKAKKSETVIFSIEDFERFPDLIASDLNFKNPTQISDANPQQKEFIWGTAELYTWASLDGKILYGTLHKPENFDPNKKYPMIVNFYEKNSQRLYSHHIPENHRSTIDYHYYTSNGYIVFNPDVYYKTGYPGEDAFNCVMPGITALIKEGFINEKAIGAQGHSWGGYQVAYLATRTNLFAAIESGAPVVNMLSAYGGIRWNTGLNRAFQYEHTQSRIGKNIWESPLRYIENSPIFTLDKINTPILIMHNDHDGYVPWWQGIEFFIGLRRLGKPAWLLNYNNADHWPQKHKNKYDFQLRMQQFFDHYLKCKPMPKWMQEGIPAVKKGYEMGYELEE